MKKKLLIISLCVFAVLGALGIIIFNEIFPKAPPVEKVLGTVISVECAGIGDSDFLSMIESARRTRRMSVNDAPAVSEYRSATVNTENGSFACFVYEEYGKTYIEFPYIGIYEVK